MGNSGAFSRIVRAADRLPRFFGGSHGNVSPLIALMLVPIIGGLGMGAEGGTFFLAQRAMQNTADAAVLAAAQNGCAASDACATAALSPTYDAEAKAVTAKMGFPHGGDIVVTTSNAAPCPAGGSTCFSVAIAKKVPFYLLKVVGFTGDTTTSGGVAASTIRAGALAQLQPGSGFCVQALDTGDKAIEFKGTPKLDLTGCDMLSNGGASCNGQSGTTIRYAYVHNTGKANDNCGTEKVTSTVFTDNYNGLKSNLPNDPCGAADATNYPQMDKFGNIASTNEIRTAAALTGGQLCGDQKLMDDITISSDSQIKIYNGQLNLNGHTLKTSDGAHLTIILSGSTLNSGSFTPASIISGSGTLDYSAPTTGTWAGVALYQSPTLGSKNVVDMTSIGNTPAFNITGLIYMPLATVTMGGAINHATGGDACIAFIVKSFQSNGTGSIFAYPTRQCDRAGLTGLAKVDNRAVLVG